MEWPETASLRSWRLSKDLNAETVWAAGVFVETVSWEDRAAGAQDLEAELTGVLKEQQRSFDS